MNGKKALWILLALFVTGSLLVSATFAQPEREREDRDRPERLPGTGHPGEALAGPGPWREQAEHIERMLALVERMEDTCFDPGRAGLIAIGGLKDEVRRKPAEVIEDLERQLKKTETLGLRNAIRLTLKDLYKLQGDDKEVLEHLRAMLAENDEAMQDEEEQHRREEEERDED